MDQNINIFFIFPSFYSFCHPTLSNIDSTIVHWALGSQNYFRICSSLSDTKITTSLFPKASSRILNVQLEFDVNVLHYSFEVRFMLCYAQMEIFLLTLLPNQLNSNIPALSWFFSKSCYVCMSHLPNSDYNQLINVSDKTEEQSEAGNFWTPVSSILDCQLQRRKAAEYQLLEVSPNMDVRY